MLEIMSRWRHEQRKQDNSALYLNKIELDFMVYFINKSLE